MHWAADGSGTERTEQMGTLLLSRADVAGLIDMGEMIAAVEAAFQEYAHGCCSMPSKSYVQLAQGDFRAMPGSLRGAAGIKWVSVHPGNPQRGLPTVMGIIIYNDPDTGYPLAVMDATEITAYRTAATSAIASRYLARKDSRSLGLIGAGRQARMHLQSHALLFGLDSVKVYDIRPEAAAAFVRSFSQPAPRFSLAAATAEEAASSDIVCTVTTARGPVLFAPWIRPGTHINAVGADAPGKQELDAAILKKARVIVDDRAQAQHGGEINVPLARGEITEQDIYATLSEVVSGSVPGRAQPDGITVFDSTGLAIEDVAAARLLYDKAQARGGYRVVDIV